MKRSGHSTASVLPFRDEVLEVLRPLHWDGMPYKEMAQHLTKHFGYRYTGDTVQRACTRHMLERAPDKQAEIDDHYNRQDKKLTVEDVNSKRLVADLPGERSLAYVSRARHPPDNPRRHVPPGTFKTPEGGFSMLRRMG